MKLLLYSINYAPELTGIGKYNGEMAEYFVAKGHGVTVVTAYPYYPEWRVADEYRKHRLWFKRETVNGVDVIRCPIYVPGRVNAITRILHLSSFAVTSFFALLWIFFKKFDVVFCVQPTLTTTPGAIIFSKLKRCHSIMHIQDFELDAMLALMGDRIPGVVKRLAFAIESLLMRGFDQITTISHKMRERARGKVRGARSVGHGARRSEHGGRSTEHGGRSREVGARSAEKERSSSVSLEETTPHAPSSTPDPEPVEGTPKRVALLPNWSDLEFIKSGEYSEVFRKRLGIDEDHCLFLYSGNIGKKQGMENLIQVAKRLEHKSDLKFVIVGTGAGKAEVVKQSEELGLKNISFHPLQPLEDLPTMLKSANYHLVLQKGDAGDLVLPSKLTNILGAGGHAIVTAHDDTELGIIAKENEGLMRCITPDCPNTLHDELLDSYRVWEKTKEIAMNKAALLYAEKNLDKREILNEFIREIEERMKAET